MRRGSTAVLISALALLGYPAAAQSVSSQLGLVVYPSNKQDAAQVAKDEGECHAWARQNTGVDPANPLAGVQVQQAAPPPGGGPRPDQACAAARSSDGSSTPTSRANALSCATPCGVRGSASSRPGE